MQPCRFLPSPRLIRDPPFLVLQEYGAEENASKHLWLGNLNARLPRATLKSVFEVFGPVEDVVTFPGRMYAFVNFRHPEDARRAREQLDEQQARDYQDLGSIQGS